jgi:SNF2 family DNA or RNA helicase
VAIGNEKQRLAALEKRADVTVCNYESAPWLLRTMHAKKIGFDIVICDESDKLKAHDSVRFKGSSTKKQPGLKHLSTSVKRWVNMTGTPAASGLHDLWSQMHLIEPSLLGKNITEFRTRWFRQDWTGYGYTAIKGAQDEILKLIEPYCLTMRAEDYITLPPIIFNDVDVPLPDEATKVYAQMKDNFLVTVDDTPVTAANAAILTSRLRQVTSGFLYTDEDGRYSELHEAKLDALDDIVGESGGKPLLVFYFWKASLQRLLKRFKHAVQLGDDPHIVTRFNMGEIPMLLAHPQSAGHGLSLHHACSTAVFFDLDWDLRGYQQAIERIGPTRQAQGGYNRTVVIHRLLAQDSIDHLVKRRLDTKASVQDLILDWMKK